MVASEAIAKFLIGGFVGWLWEKRFSPGLKGAMPGVPFRPIYGFGAAMATPDLDRNILLSIAAEKLGNSGEKLWRYDPRDPMVIDEDVRADYAIYFGEAMTVFSRLCDHLVK